MQAALGLARRGLGTVWPNPSVGCVIVTRGRVVGRARTAHRGRPHAETQALAAAGPAARGATAYVTLEPCSHHGETAPCADALIAAQIARVVASIEDPDPRVSGQGLARLRAAGVAVELGPGAEEAREINAGFIMRVTAGRPLVTLKLAASIDGAIAMRSREGRWLTAEPARAFAHRLRAEYDAIMVGSGTAIQDDPELTCRLPGLEYRSPLRIVIDGRLRLNLASRLVATAREVPTLVITSPGNQPRRIEALAGAGVEVIEIEGDEGGKVDLAAALGELGRRGLTRLLVEGGSHLAAALLRRDLIDRLAWFHAPMLLGGDAMPAVVALGLERLDDAPRFVRQGVAEIGRDLFVAYRKAEA